MTLEVTAYSGLGPGAHDVAVTDVQVKVAKAGGNYLRWEFTDAEGKTASANTSQEMTPGNKTGKWFAALLGKPITVGERYELADVIGRPAQIFLELNPEGYPKVISLVAREVTRRAANPIRHEGQEFTEPDPTPKDDALPF